MHDTAFEIGKLFFETYFPTEPDLILEVGSQDINGSLRSCAPIGSTYFGVDLEPGAGVDVVLSDPHKFPFVEDNFDAVISTSAFEHDQMFWLTFLEMERVTKNGGYIYISAPSNGWYHPYPGDNWRFYPDSGLALTAWAHRQGRDIILMESFIARRRADIWNDCVLVFRKGADADTNDARIVDRLPDAYNVRRHGQVDMLQRNAASEDMQLIARLRGQLVAKHEEVLALTALFDSCSTKLSDLESQLRAALDVPKAPPGPP